MRLHHIGIAVKSIRRQAEEYKRILETVHVSEIVYDSVQKAWLCMIEQTGGSALELVEGEPVEKYLSKGIRMYHMCYEVEELETEMERILQNGGVLVSGPEAAVLFGGRRVAFLYTKAGLIELLEEGRKNEAG